MTLFDALVLGIVQGLTEFLPVSSSGHLMLIRWLRGGQSAAGDVAFDVVLHLATLLAVCIAFRQALLRVLTKDRRVLLLLAISTSFLAIALLPVGGGLRVKDFVERARETPAIVGCGFLFTAFLLALMSSFGLAKAEAKEGTQEFSIFDALIIGFLQLLAILPGVSRSGSTIVGGLFRGGSPNLAFEYAFLLSIPAILGAVVVEGRGIIELTQVQPLPLVVGFISALFTGLGAISLLRFLLSRDRFWLFIPYLLLCAGLAFAL
jgi:undecaprenyl-diphosphatase